MLTGRAQGTDKCPSVSPLDLRENCYLLIGKAMLLVAGKMAIEACGLSNPTSVLTGNEGAIHAVNFIHDASHAISFGKSANWVVEMIELDPGEITQPSYPASISRWDPPLSRKSGTHRRPCRCASMKLWEDPVTLPPAPSVPSDPTATAWQIINEVLANVALTPALYPSLVLHASPQSILSLPSLLPLLIQPVPSHLLSFPVSI